MSPGCQCTLHLVFHMETSSDSITVANHLWVSHRGELLSAFWLFQAKGRKTGRDLCKYLSAKIQRGKKKAFKLCNICIFSTEKAVRPSEPIFDLYAKWHVLEIALMWVLCLCKCASMCVRVYMCVSDDVRVMHLVMRFCTEVTAKEWIRVLQIWFRLISFDPVLNYSYFPLLTAPHTLHF